MSFFINIDNVEKEQRVFNSSAKNRIIENISLLNLRKLSKTGYDIGRWKKDENSTFSLKRLNKENFTLKSISNKIMLCGGQHYFVLKKMST